ncbi:NUDIX domain-containing protein [Streptomyces halstedii]|uniref:NUDIX domain-containing protein n=1 Tax=Streptomyces halstedii TaxID=1944 RepID=UPI0036A87AF1
MSLTWVPRSEAPLHRVDPRTLREHHRGGDWLQPHPGPREPRSLSDTDLWTAREELVAVEYTSAPASGPEPAILKAVEELLTRGFLRLPGQKSANPAASPGGGVNPGEPPATAASRKIMEELGVAMAVDQALAVDWVAPGAAPIPAGHAVPRRTPDRFRRRHLGRGPDRRTKHY